MRNPGKKAVVTVGGDSYVRYPIRTHLISVRDRLEDVIKKYARPHLQEGDFLAVSERIVAIMQGRSFLIADINPSWWALTLQRFVSRHPGGIGLKSPYTMELAIQEVGLARILCAAFISCLTRPFGIRGLFYYVAGSHINAIDGPCVYTLPPGDKSAKLGPKNPQSTAEHISTIINAPAVIIDANDYGVRVIGYSSGIDKKKVEKIFRDNPLGQAREQTPLAIVRKKSLNAVKVGR